MRIKWGTLAGVESILPENRGRQMLVLSIEVLQQGAKVRIGAADSKPV